VILRFYAARRVRSAQRAVSGPPLRRCRALLHRQGQGLSVSHVERKVARKLLSLCEERCELRESAKHRSVNRLTGESG
jgi:hypothetical protein